jgi:hypothetical protein
VSERKDPAENWRLCAKLARVYERRWGYERGDRLGEAYIIFHEACQSFDRSRGSFISWAKLKINRDLVENFRREHRIMAKRRVIYAPTVHVGAAPLPRDGPRLDMKELTTSKHQVREEQNEVREEIAQLLGRGVRQKEIALVLGLTDRVVAAHVEFMRKNREAVH